MGIKGRLTAFLARRTQDGDGHLTVENTGPVAQSDGGVAVSGYSGPPPRRGQRITVKNTGAASASGPGSRAVSGIDYT